MLRVLVVGVMIVTSACSSGSQSIDMLEDAPIHSEVAELMPAGRLAMLQAATISEYQLSMEARAYAAVALWEHWADAIDECFDSWDIAETSPRFEAPTEDDPIWDLMREPDHQFRPYGEEWNAEHGFSSSAPREFWNSAQITYLEMDSTAFFTTDCARVTYPYDELIVQPGEDSSYGGFLDSLALTLLERLATPDWVDVSTVRLDELWDQVDLMTCLAEGGVPQWVLDSDHYEVFAGAVWDEALTGTGDEQVLAEAARYSVVEARCFDTVFGPVDDELYRMAVDFAQKNDRQLNEALAVNSRVNQWIEQLPAR